jgi:dihydrofolate synthase/folylpolyglutamate synthase
MIVKRQTELFCEWLENYLDFERIKKKEEFSLKTMQFLVDRFKHPEKSFKSIHVAGSKGKGSVSAMIASILDTAGKRTGLYTSPHILDFTERIAMPSDTFSDEIYGRACDIVVPLVDSIIPGTIPGNVEPSWFELVTLFAFVTFKEAGLEWAVIETGLGGRLDATNVVLPEACVLTPIELEHTEYLGDTIEKIAGEKAGIIKDGVPVFIASQKIPVRNVFASAAMKKNAPIFSMDDAMRTLESSVSAEGLEITVEFNELPGGARFSRPLSAKLSLVNEIQASNAALAAYTVKTLYPDIAEDVIERGLSRAWIPGRFEIVRGDVPVVLDGAHTVRSVQLTLDTFRKVFPEAAHGSAHLLFACAADKNVDSMASLLPGLFSRVTVTRPGDRKSSDIDHEGNAFRAAFGAAGAAELRIDADYRLAIQESYRAAVSAGVPLLVTGSFYLVAEVKKTLFSRSAAPES